MPFLCDSPLLQVLCLFHSLLNTKWCTLQIATVHPPSLLHIVSIQIPCKLQEKTFSFSVQFICPYPKQPKDSWMTRSHTTLADILFTQVSLETLQSIQIRQGLSETKPLTVPLLLETLMKVKPGFKPFLNSKCLKLHLDYMKLPCFPSSKHVMPPKGIMQLTNMTRLVFPSTLAVFNELFDETMKLESAGEEPGHEKKQVSPHPALLHMVLPNGTKVRYRVPLSSWETLQDVANKFQSRGVPCEKVFPITVKPMAGIPGVIDKLNRKCALFLPK